MSFKPTRPAALFSATWDYLPRPILEMVRYIPVNPFKRLHNLKWLFTQHGTLILRQQRAAFSTGVDQAGNSKDVMSLLSECVPPLPPVHSYAHLLSTMIICSQSKCLGRPQGSPV